MDDYLDAVNELGRLTFYMAEDGGYSSDTVVHLKELAARIIQQTRGDQVMRDIVGSVYAQLAAELHVGLNLEWLAKNTFKMLQRCEDLITVQRNEASSRVLALDEVLNKIKQPYSRGDK